MSEKKTNSIRHLEKNKINFEKIIFKINEEHIDAVHVADLIGYEAKYVYKTLVLQGSDKNYYVCVIESRDELDLKKVAKAFNIKNISMINLNDINKVTGYVRGGCSPIGMKKQFDTIIDAKAENLDYIIVSAGQRGMQIKLRVNELKDVVKAKYEDVIKS